MSGQIEHAVAECEQESGTSYLSFYQTSESQTSESHTYSIISTDHMIRGFKCSLQVLGQKK